MPDTQPTSWSSVRTKPLDEAQNKAEKRRSVVNTILTLVLAAAIIVAGFVTPSIFYSATDTERGILTDLSDPASEEVLMRVFDEPVSLYPWDLYNEENTSPLSLTQRTFLIENNVPNFLITNMMVYGMNIELLEPYSEQTPTEYASALLIDAFTYLQTDTESAEDCFVINDLDVNKDGIADLRCAVDQYGTIISLVFMSEPWIAPEEVEQNTPPSTEDPAAGAAAGGPGSAAGTGDGGSEPETLPAEGSSYALDLTGLEQTPAGEERALWSYTHLIALSATENGQLALGEAAALLDAGFNERYTNPEAPQAAQTYVPSYTVFATEDYLLYIFDLPTGVRFILYYDSTSSRCVGFNLQI